VGSASGDSIEAIFGPFRLQRLLGVSRVTEVWSGVAPGGVGVAVKRLLPHLSRDPLLRAALGHEADVLRRVGGRWPVPRLQDVDLEAARAPLPFLARASVRGAPLSALAASPMPARIAGLGALCDALAALHGAGFACGDVAPRNVVIDRNERAWIIDLGAGRVLDMASEEEAVPLGGVATPAFASPEVAAGDRADAASDTFSFATVACWLLTGATPWSSLRGEARRAAIAAAQRAPDAPECPGALGELLRPCWERDPLERPYLADLAAAWPRSAEASRALCDAVLAVPQGEPLRLAAAAEDRGEVVTGPDDPDATCYREE
jgi:serine/threonine protein kinase